jgi:hypothetical protein
MKIKLEHLKTLATSIQPFDTDELRSQYKAQGLSDKRYRWDLTYLANSTRFICDVLYEYMDDSHVDTALRKIVKPL